MRFLKSLKYASRGLRFVFSSEKNFKIQIVMAVLVLFFSFYFQINSNQLVVLILLIALVLVMEIINTAFEYLTDLLKPRLHSYVYTIKDLMSGAVLLISATSAIIGLIIFYPYIIKMF